MGGGGGGGGGGGTYRDVPGGTFTEGSANGGGLGGLGMTAVGCEIGSGVLGILGRVGGGGGGTWGGGGIKVGTGGGDETGGGGMTWVNLLLVLGTPSGKVVS